MHFLYDSLSTIYNLVILFWVDCQYTINVLYHCVVSPFSCGGYSSSLIKKGSLVKRLVVCQCFLVGGLKSPIYYVLIEHGCLFQKGDLFRHYHRVGNHIPYCSRKLSPLLKLFNQSGKGFCGVVSTYNIHQIFF